MTPKLAAGATLTTDEFLPLVTRTLELVERAGEFAKTVFALDQPIAMYEATVSSQSAKPAIGDATKLDPRLKAQSDRLLAVPDRLGQCETAAMRLCKSPFLGIDTHDNPRKLANRGIDFDVMYNVRTAS